MPTRKENLINNEIYHIVIRGIEGIDIFRSEKDYYRAIHNLFEFNDFVSTNQLYRRSYSIDSRLRYDRTRDLLVEVMSFCLMPNHIHLLLRQIKEDGIIKFMRKFGTGYANYFNKKYKRQGYLFQGRFRSIRVRNDNQLKSVFVYIHTNPAALIDFNWKEGNIKDSKEVMKFIENYKWSSYMDYLGRNNFPSITHRDFFNQMMTWKEWQKFVNEWVLYKNQKEWSKSIELE